MQSGIRRTTGFSRARRRQPALGFAAAGVILSGLALAPGCAWALSAPSVSSPVTVPTLPVPSLSPTGPSVTLAPVTAPTLPSTPSVTLGPVTVPTLPSVGGVGPVGATIPSGTPATASTGSVAPAGGSPADPAGVTSCATCGSAPGRPTSAERPAGTTATGSAAGESLVRRSLRDAAGAGFPIALVLLGLVYLLVQGRIDRRDPKLASASLRDDRWVSFAGDQPQTGPGRAGRDGLVSLEERLRSMQLARAGLAVLAVVLSAALGSGRPPLGRMLAVTVAYGLVIGCAGSVWKAWRRRSLMLLGSLFTLDGIFLAWLVLVTGGVGSPLQYLVPLYVATVALVASYRTGVRVAVWNSLLAVGAYYGSAASVLPGSHPPGPGGFTRLVVFVVVLWVTAVVTATFSAVNERELRRRRFRLEMLHQLALEVGAAPTAEAAAAAAVDAAVDGLGFRRALLVAGRDGRLALLAQRGAADEVAGGSAAPSGDRLFRSGPVTVLASRLDAGANPWTARRLPGATGVAVVPLVVGGRTSGAVVVEHGGRRIDRGMLSTLEQAVSHAALAVGNRWLLEQIEALASTDGLTGLANRRSFDAAIERESARAVRGVGALSLVMVDIDHFKRVNDVYGHTTGDEVIRLVAGVVRSVVRPYDVVARYGGEEIAVLLPDCSLARARRTAERLRAAVAAAESPVQVTISAGVAALAPGEQAGDLLRRADAALYRSKRAGRNRVTADDGSSPVVRIDAARRPAPGGRRSARRALSG